MSEHIINKETRSTPYFKFDFEKGMMMLEGISIPEDSLKFYFPIMELADVY